MINYQYTSSGYRPIEKIKQIVADGGRILEVGGANSFANDYIDSIIEIRQPQASAKHIFLGDMCFPELWEEVFAHVEKYGKWDYAICSHTLEDLNNPVYVARNIEKVASAGIIIVPSKYRELARFSSPEFRGFKHHRHTFDFVDGVFTSFPKSSYLESKKFDNVHLKLDGREELIYEWENEIGLKEINGGMPFDGDTHFEQCYDKLIDNE